MARKKGPTPRRRHDVESKLRGDYATLYAEIGREKVARLDAEREAAGLRLQLEAAQTANDVLAAALIAARPIVNETAFADGVPPADRAVAIRVLRDMRDATEAA